MVIFSKLYLLIVVLSLAVIEKMMKLKPQQNTLI